MALCTRDKGVFDAVETVIIANRLAADGSPPLRFHLVVAGTFPDPVLQEEFSRRIARADAVGRVRQVGFLSGVAKADAFRAADVFLFPSYYATEGQPLAVVEAMAHGLPVVTTYWRAIPEMLPQEAPESSNPDARTSPPPHCWRSRGGRTGLAIGKRSSAASSYPSTWRLWRR